jgi:hypothetical protein
VGNKSREQIMSREQIIVTSSAGESAVSRSSSEGCLATKVSLYSFNVTTLKRCSVKVRRNFRKFMPADHLFSQFVPSLAMNDTLPLQQKQSSLSQTEVIHMLLIEV